MREHFSIVLCYSDGRKLQHIIAILARLNKNCVKKNLNFCPCTKYCISTTAIDSCLFSRTLNTLISLLKFVVIADNLYTLIKCAAAVLFCFCPRKSYSRLLEEEHNQVALLV